MLPNNKTEEYLESLIINESFPKMRDFAAKNNVPIVPIITANFLKTIIAIKNPKNILEIGTAIGYSASIMSNDNNKIITIEKDEKYFEIAKNNTKNKNIDVILGDGGEVIKTFEDNSFDMIFLDSAKGQYIKMLPDLTRIMKNGAVLVCDNVLYKGKIASGEYEPHKHRTIVTNLRAFLKEISQNNIFQTSIINIGDGVSVSVKI
jgi:predicted O-methyltransferase YrrM